MVQILFVGKVLFIKIQRDKAALYNNDITSNYFTIEREVRQGDPLSPCLFVVVVDTLATGQNSGIKGITIYKKATKLLQHADDTTAVLSDSAQTLFRPLDDFKKLLGLEINPTKTEGMWIGSSRENKTKFFVNKWPNEPTD